MHHENWEDMRLFRIFAGAGSIAAGARAAGMHRISLARRIRALEGALGLKLVKRSPRRVRLTEAGRRALGHADEMAAAWLGASLDAPPRKAAPGQVRIAAPEGLAGWLLAPFASLHDDEDARLVFVEAEAEKAEIRLAFGPSPRGRRIARLEYGVYFAPLAADVGPFGPPWIEQGPPGSDLREWLDDCFDGAAGLAPAEARDPASAAALIRAGAGRGWLPVRMAEGDPVLMRRDRSFTRRRDLWMEVAAGMKGVTRVERAVEWVRGCAGRG